MKTCPHCHKTLPITAVRCRYCRRPLSTKRYPLYAMKWLTRTKLNLEPGLPSWSVTEVLLLWLVVFLASLGLEYYEITPRIMDLLKGRYFILIKEPALQFHLHVFIATFILKLSAVIIILAILKMHRASPVSGLGLIWPVKKGWLWLFPAFFLFAVMGRLLSDIDPLSPNLPIYLFFKESSIIGNIITLFSLIIIAPVAEEIFFRGFIYPGINKRLGFFWALLITSLLFMAVHIPQCREHPFILSTIFLGGVFLTLARALTKSTLVPILLHALYNGAIVLVGFIKFLIFKY